MAQRRMFSRDILRDDLFLDLPFSSQTLYVQLSMDADDDGFVNSPKRIMRMIGADDSDFDNLENAGFIIRFDSGVMVITHWKINNFIQKDRYKPTLRKEEMQQISLVNGMYTTCIQDVSSLSAQYRLGKDRLGKDSLGKDSLDKHTHGVCGNVILSEDDYQKLQDEFPEDYSERIDDLSLYMKSTGKTYDDHLATILNWERMKKQKQDLQNKERDQHWADFMERHKGEFDEDKEETTDAHEDPAEEETAEVVDDFFSEIREMQRKLSDDMKP